MVKEKFSAYILAGGKSRRLGTDKLYVRIGGRPLLERTIDVCKSCFETVKLVTASCEELSAPDCGIIADSPLAKGPMGGVIAALEDCRSDYCFITAADLPDLSSEIILALTERRRRNQYVGVMEKNGLQPLCGFYHISSLPVLIEAAGRKEYSLNRTMRFLSHTGMIPGGEQWRNINRPQDLAMGEIHA